VLKRIELNQTSRQPTREFTPDNGATGNAKTPYRAGWTKQFPAVVSFEVRRQLEKDHPHLTDSRRGAIQEILGSHTRSLRSMA